MSIIVLEISRRHGIECQSADDWPGIVRLEADRDIDMSYCTYGEDVISNIIDRLAKRGKHFERPRCNLTMWAESTAEPTLQQVLMEWIGLRAEAVHAFGCADAVQRYLDGGTGPQHHAACTLLRHEAKTTKIRWTEWPELPWGDDGYFSVSPLIDPKPGHRFYSVITPDFGIEFEMPDKGQTETWRMKKPATANDIDPSVKEWGLLQQAADEHAAPIIGYTCKLLP